MTRLLLVSAFLLGYAAIFLVAADVAAEPPTTDKPQLQIIYNEKLREAMKRFQITEADMNEMLTNYMESGKAPTITKSILNPETNLQEVKNKTGLYKELFKMCLFVKIEYAIFSLSLPEILMGIEKIERSFNVR